MSSYNNIQVKESRRSRREWKIQRRPEVGATIQLVVLAIQEAEAGGLLETKSSWSVQATK